ncbi:cobyric acid synthase [Shewanella surugensis]|uniref:Cobyric acid synthase n=1 Tax=Shewanella surugensis TaxID=212020 RepID=A0ABT0LGP7_9GAMM|nr:cobyric acid synthase [Shewanella surugensis]MCL1126887.1 cobyric acid synthase [Shewanella surugensis]
MTQASKAKMLMVQGTTSDAGKSTLVAGLCRVFARKNINVAPFKPQNMALNSAVTCDGGEIGRAQALQAYACGLEPHTDFNPILLKPSSNTRSQVIVQGKALLELEAQAFFGPDSQRYKAMAMEAVLDSFSRLRAQYEWILIEGAGSPAEINLREGDIANMGFAEAVDCPVIIIADIDKGGVFAHLVGTLALLSESEQARVKGFVINRFRGDISLLQSGIDWLEEYTHKPVFGVLPYLQNLHLEAEDAISSTPDKSTVFFKVLVLVYPRISNHTDFDPLRLHPNIEFSYVSIQTPAEESSLPQADLIILPGSKNVRDDLACLKKQGWERHIKQHLRYGGKVLGICGGYQMLGHVISDPDGVEGEKGCSLGLSLLPIATTLTQRKTLTQVAGYIQLLAQRALIKGYEIHCGHTRLLESGVQPISFYEKVFCEGPIDEQPLGKESLCQEVLNKGTSYDIMGADTSAEFIKEGLLSHDGQILGTYIHGVFDSPEAGQLLLKWAGMREVKPIDVNEIKEQQLERLANVLEQHLDLAAFEAF